MRLQTDRLSEPYRSMVRFLIVGISGTILQYALYSIFLHLLCYLWGEVGGVVSAAFTLGFLLEMVLNYVITSYYTFSTKPNWKNAGGFICGRGVNYTLQMGFLWAGMAMGLSNRMAGIVAIVIAGIINYFVTRIFFREKKQ